MNSIKKKNDGNRSKEKSPNQTRMTMNTSVLDKQFAKKEFWHRNIGDVNNLKMPPTKNIMHSNNQVLQKNLKKTIDRENLRLYKAIQLQKSTLNLSIKEREEQLSQRKKLISKLP